MNLLQWCDNNISFLKENGIKFVNGFPLLPTKSIYSGHPLRMSTFAHRNDIPHSDRKNTLICFYSQDRDLFPRLEKIDSELPILQNYAGICGFDLSPCVGMLRIRQKFHLLISAIYNCRCALYGIKVLPNSRMGDLGTINQVTSLIPHGSNIVSGELGCRGKAFKAFGLYQLKESIRIIEPNSVFIYGSFCVKDAKYCAPAGNVTFFVFPDRRNSMRNSKKPYIIQSGIEQTSEMFHLQARYTKAVI